MYVDLDGFKGVNDRAGHAMGDRVLSAVGARLRHAVRSADLVARIGGDEFAVLCEGLGEEELAEVVANRIASALAESVELEGERWAVSASVGAAVDVEGHLSASELIDRADRAMYSVKYSRRGQRTASGTPNVPVGADFGQESPVGDKEDPPATSQSAAASPPERRVSDRRAAALGTAGSAASTLPVAGSGIALLDGVASLKDSIESLRVALEKLLASGRRDSDWNFPDPVQT